jgi:hypothetical protein
MPTPCPRLFSGVAGAFGDTVVSVPKLSEEMSAAGFNDATPNPSD